MEGGSADDFTKYIRKIRKLMNEPPPSIRTLFGALSTCPQ
jgi:hypothetical protein